MQLFLIAFVGRVALVDSHVVSGAPTFWVIEDAVLRFDPICGPLRRPFEQLTLEYY